MIQNRPVTNEDAGAGCPVPLVTLGESNRFEAKAFSAILADIPEQFGAHEATFLDGPSDTHELGFRVAATCDEGPSRSASAPLGEAIDAQSRDGNVRATHGETRWSQTQLVSLPGQRCQSGRHA